MIKYCTIFTRYYHDINNTLEYTIWRGVPEICMYDYFISYRLMYIPVYCVLNFRKTNIMQKQAKKIFFTNLFTLTAACRGVHSESLIMSTSLPDLINSRKQLKFSLKIA